MLRYIQVVYFSNSSWIVLLLADCLHMIGTIGSKLLLFMKLHVMFYSYSFDIIFVNRCILILFYISEILCFLVN